MPVVVSRGRRTRAVAVVLLTGLVAGLFGVPTASVEGALGPHRAGYAMTLEDEVRVNLGPLGSLALDSPLPWPLGVEVLVQEIPADLALTADNPTFALADDLEEYLQFFAQPDLSVRRAGADLGRDALGRTVVAWSVLLLLAAAAVLASRGGLLRFHLRAAFGRPGVAVLVCAALGAAVGVPIAAGGPERPEGRRAAVLAGTPLADARIVGRLGDLIDAYGARALQAIEENRVFYAAAARNLEQAYALVPDPARPGSEFFADGAPTDGAPTDGAPPEGAPTDGAPTDGAPTDGAPTDGAPTDGAPTDGAPTGASAQPTGATAPGAGVDPDAATISPTASPTPAPTGTPADWVTFLLVSDLHCNVGMAEVVGQAARLTGAAAVLNAGDTVISGTSVERFCVDALAAAVPQEVPIVVAAGNHDGLETVEQQRRSGSVILEGDPVEVAGVRFLGDVEPTLTVLAGGTRLKGEENRAEQGLRLADVACAEQAAGSGIDVLMVHNPRAGSAAMESGCVPLQLSGHMHRRIGPTPQGLGLLYVTPSAGGALLGGRTIGPLQAPAELTVLLYDPVGRLPVAYRLLTIGEDASARVGEWAAFPQPSPVPVVADLSGEVATR